MFKNNIKIDFDCPRAEGPLIILSKISKNFSTQTILQDIDLVINASDRIAIVGPNGTGKSTLLKIITGALDPDGGEVSRNKNLKIGYLPQETNWNSLKNTILEEIKTADPDIFNLINQKKSFEAVLSDTKRKDLKEKIKEYGEITHGYEANKGYEYERLTEETLEKFGFPQSEWERKVKSLSGGERTRLALAKIILQKPNMLVLDEPTNHLDLETINWLENLLFNWHMAVVVVSHDAAFLDFVCDKTFELSKNGLEKYYCKYSEYLEEKKERNRLAEEAKKRQDKYLSGQEEFIERFRYKATKAKAVQSRIKLLEKMEKAPELEKDSKKISIRFKSLGGLPEKVLEITDLVAGVDGTALVMLEGEWEINKADKIGIIGANGAGKSTILKTLNGSVKPIEGKVVYSKKIKTGYYAQAHEELDPEKSIFDEVRSKTGAEDQDIRSILGSLLFSGEDAFKMVSDLSGGERARVAIAELILNNSNMILLDEPTNHLDLASKDRIAEVLKSFNGPIIMVSHDRSVLNKVCNIIWEVKDGEAKRFEGNYTDYKHKKDNSL